MSNRINELIKMSGDLQKSLNVNLELLNLTMEETLKEAPASEKHLVEKAIFTTKNAIELAKLGKQSEANELIKNLQNECSNKK